MIEENKSTDDQKVVKKDDQDKDYKALYENMQAENKRKTEKLEELKGLSKTNQEELDSFRKDKEAKVEKDKIAKWKQNEVIEEMKTKYADYDELKTYREESIAKKEAHIQEQLEKIPADEKEFVSKILSNAKSVSEKQELLDSLITKFWEKKDRGKEPTQKKKASDPTELDRLKEKKENGKLSPSETINYISLLRKE